MLGVLYDLQSFSISIGKIGLELSHPIPKSMFVHWEQLHFIRAFVKMFIVNIYDDNRQTMMECLFQHWISFIFKPDIYP